MNRLHLSAIFLPLGIATCRISASAQPDVLPEPKTRVPALSITELEKLVGGRTTLSLELQNAPIEAVAAAMSASSGQKIEARPASAFAPIQREGRPAFQAPPLPLYSFSAAKTPFWEALRALQLAARRAAETANALDSKPRFSRGDVPNSVGLQKSPAGWFVQPDTSLTTGRAVAAWPFLLVATDIRRSQEAKFSQEGLREIETQGAFATFRANADEKKPVVPAAPTPEADRWLDGLMLNGQSYLDPKLKPSGLWCEVVEATDDKGNDLRLSAGDALSTIGSFFSFGGAGTSLRIPLRSRPGMGKRLVKLRGVMHFNVVTRSQHWETTQLDTPIQGTVFQNGGEFKVSFDGLKKSGEGWAAGFSAESRGAHLQRMWEEAFNSRAAPGSRPGASMMPGSSRRMGNVISFEGVTNIRLIDDAGRVFEGNDIGSNNGFFTTTTSATRGMSGFGSVMSNGDGIINSFSLQNIVPPPGGATSPGAASLDASPVPPDAAQNWIYKESKNIGFRSDSATGERISIGKPVKLILDLPLERREVSVPFEFTDLPLPPS